MDIGQIDKSEGEDEDVHAVQQRRLHDRSNQSPTTSENLPTVGLPVSAPVFLSFPVCLHTVVVHVRALWTADRPTRSRHGSRNKTAHIHPSLFFD